MAVAPIRALAAIGTLLLFGTMVVTCIDVFGRYFLNTPLPGGFELTEVMMAGLIFLGLPLVTRNDEHIKVDLLDQFLSARVRSFQSKIAYLISGGMSAIIAWTLWVKAGQVAAHNDYSEILHIPLAPVTYLMAVMMGGTAAIFFWKLVFGSASRRPDAP